MSLADSPKVGLFWFGSAWFYGISTIVGYLVTNAVDTHILGIYDL